MRPITDIIREYRNGRLADLASLRMAELIQAVDETNKPGKIIIEIKVAPEKGGGSQKDIQAKVNVKLPELDLPSAVFYSDDEGNLHRTDPAQTEMRFREAGGESGAARA